MTWAAVIVAAMVAAASAVNVHAQPISTRETVTAIQIQGNTLTPDEEVRRLAGVTVGMPFAAATIEEVADRLRATKQFKQIDVRKRFASIEDPSQIVLVIIVDEGAVRVEMTGDEDRPARVVKDGRPKIMFLPVLSGEDGYGLTYGVRFALPDPIGRSSRISFPLTWGGTKQAGAELEKTFDHAPVNRILGGVSISRRTNPFYEQDDERAGVWVRGEREIVHALRIGATAGIQHDSFADADDQFAHAGADIVLDTRIDPVLPRNAVYAKAAWEHLAFDDSLNRTELEARGYIGLFGQNILALRAIREDASEALPPYLQALLGGMSNLRGFRAGFDAGDTLVATSAEVIVPLTSPLHIGKVGVSAFADWGTVYDKGERLSEQTLRQGYGGSVWFSAAFLRLNLAVAHGRGSTTRVHANLNVSF